MYAYLCDVAITFECPLRDLCKKYNVVCAEALCFIIRFHFSGGVMSWNELIVDQDWSLSFLLCF